MGEPSSMSKSGKTINKILRLVGIAALLATGLTSTAARAVPVSLQNATATFSQTAGSGGGVDYSVANSIDGVTNHLFNGWASGTLNGTTDQIAVWETVTDVNATTLEIKLIHNAANNLQHLLGNFRLSVTSDNRDTFANSAATGGDVTANWTELTNATVSNVSSSQGMLALSVLGDNSILATTVSGDTPTTATYTISYSGLFAGITGIRLETLTNNLLPFDGPGMYPLNGNFLLSEITLDVSGDIETSVVPVPAALPLFGTGLAIMGFIGWRRKRNS